MRPDILRHSLPRPTHEVKGRHARLDGQAVGCPHLVTGQNFKHDRLCLPSQERSGRVFQGLIGDQAGSEPSFGVFNSRSLYPVRSIV